MVWSVSYGTPNTGLPTDTPIIPGAGLLTIAGAAVAVGLQLSPLAGALAFMGAAPAATVPGNLTPVSGRASLTGWAPIVAISGAPTISAWPIGGLVYAGGSASFVYEGQPIFQDRIRESSISVAVNAAGWPTADFIAALYTGSRNFGWLSVGSAPFVGGFLGTGNETITGWGFGSATKTSAPGNPNVTFTVLATNAGNTGFTVGNTTGGVTNLYCYLPAYASQATAIGYSATSLFTTDFLGVSGPAALSHVRWSCFAQNAWYNGGGPQLASTVGWNTTSCFIPPWPYGTGTFLVCMKGDVNLPVTITAGNPSIPLTNSFVAGQQVQFDGIPASPSVTGFSNYANYYISATGLSSTAFQVSGTVGGAVITPAGTGSITPNVYVNTAWDVRSITITTANQTSISWTGPTTQPATAVIPQNMAANRHTAANVKFSSGLWSASGVSTEGYPADWWMDWAIASNNSPWLGIPVFTDATYLADFFSMLATKASAAGFNQPIYLELGNEVWNSGGGAGSFHVINALALYNGISSVQQMAITNRAMAVAARAAGFTTGPGGQIQIMACWQLASLYYQQDYIAYYAAQGWNIAADIAYWCTAPYWNLNQQTAAPFNYGTSMSIAQIQANSALQIQSSITTPTLVTAPATTANYAWALENTAITAQDAGLQYGTYEGQWQVNAESNTITNVGPSLMDPGQTAVMAAYLALLRNAGTALYTHTAIWVDALAGALAPGNELTTIWPLTTSTSPIWAALQAASPTLTRNLINTSGGIVSGTNFCDNRSTGTYNSLGNFNLHTTGPTNYAATQGPYTAFNSNNYGWLGYMLNYTGSAPTVFNLDVVFQGVSGTVTSGLRSGGKQLVATSPGITVWTGATTLTAAPSATATSALLSAAWANATGSYMTTFGDAITQKRASYTIGQTTISWTGALGVAQSSAAIVVAVNFGLVTLTPNSNYILLGKAATQTALVNQVQMSLPSTPPPVVTAGYKVGSGYDGDYAASINTDDVRKTGGTSNKAEMQLIKTGAVGATNILGYKAIYTIWSLCRGASGVGTVQGDYSKFSDIDTDFANLQAANPGIMFALHIEADVNPTWSNYTGTGAQTFTNEPVCAYILNCGGTIAINNKYDGTGGTTTYYPAVQSNGQCGFAYSDWDGTSKYIVLAAAIQEPAVQADRINFWNALANHLVIDPVASGGDGQMHPISTHRLFPRIRMGDEISYSFNTGPASFTGSGTSALTLVNFWNGFFNIAEAMSTTFTQIPIQHNVTYGVTGSDGSSDNASSFNVSTGYLAPTVPSLGGRRGLPFIPGTVLCPSDVYGSHWTAHYNQNLGAQAQNSLQAYFGVATATAESGSAALPTPTYAAQGNQWRIEAECQTPDPNGSTSTGSHRFYLTATQGAAYNANAAPGIAQILQAMSQAPPPGASLPSAFALGMNVSLRYWPFASQFRAVPSPYTPTIYGSSTADWNNYIHGSGPGAGVAINSSVPANLQATFNYYISTTGSDSNAGTLASPWAITAINTKQSTYAGKRLGIIAGNYDISALMFSPPSNGNHGTVLNINGGTAGSPTYIGSCATNGVYAQGVATIDAKGSSGFYGGNNANTSTMMGNSIFYTGQKGGGPTPANWGNYTVDGLQFTGFSLWAFQVGSYDGSGGQTPNTAIQNCTFHDSNGVNAPWSGTHSGVIETYSYTTCLISNCWIYNCVNSGPDNAHFASITSWGGIGTGSSTGLTIQLCTIVNTAGVYGIYDTGTISGTVIKQCYFDFSTYTGPNPVAITGYGNTAAGGLAGSSFHNNIFRGGEAMDGIAEGPGQDQWATTAAYYNNTWDLDGGAAFPSGGGVGYRFLEASGHTAVFSSYNNLFYDRGSTKIGYGYQINNVDGFAVCDYNIYGGLNTFSTYAANAGSGPTTQTFAGWKTATGKDANSTTNTTNPFTVNGTYALQYTVVTGSPAYQTGKVGGLSTGAAVNVGAWDGIVTQIGCNFAT
jgi:hypothetical protein